MKAPRWFLGADPDLHSQSVVVIDEEGKLIRIALTKVHHSITGRDAILAMAEGIGRDNSQMFAGCIASAVESQEISYTSKSGKNPVSLMLLANISGILVGHLCAACPNVFLPAPQKWKGSIAKKIHQKRICSQMGWDFEERTDYVVPDADLSEVAVVGKLNSSDWKHVLDSIGLALWVKATFLKKERRERVIASIKAQEAT